MHESPITCCACGVFGMELQALAARGLIDLRIRTLESMLHMDPVKLGKALDTVVTSHPEERHLLLYGDCHPRMREMERRKNTARTTGINCCEIILGKEAYRKLQREKAFIFLPEWAQRWREIFTRELGFEKPENARVFLKEHLDKLVYIDTGVTPVPVHLLKEISDFFAMPLEVLPITLDLLRLTIDNAIGKFSRDGTQ